MNRLLLLILISIYSLSSFSQPVSHHNIIPVGRGSGSTAKNTALVFDPALKPFYHGVASGNPTTTSVIIWTRVTPDSGQYSINGTWQLAADTGFTQLISNGTFTADTSKDYTVKLEISSLTSGTTYYYRFNALGKYSLVGRAKTIPSGNIGNLKFAIVSCSNYEGGYFNAYEKIAERNDLDAVIHLGDYIYEYGQGTYGLNLPGRNNEPNTEILTLSDYRTRYSLYRLDRDLIRLHQQHTFINIWDDHESANDSWEAGAENHQSNEGSWQVRKDISKRVYFEWMPLKNNSTNSIYRKISYGNLCDILMLDTRLEGRQEPPANFDDPDPVGNPRRIISPTQESWLISNLKSSTASWKLIGNQVLYSIFNVGFAGGYSDGVPDPTNIDSIRAAENLFIDNWESYPTQRKRILDTIRLADVDNVVFLTGDSHCSWAFDIPEKPVNYPNPLTLNIPTPNPYNLTTKEGYNQVTQEGSWAVEYATPSISSPNFDEAVGAAVTAQFEVTMNTPVVPLGGAVYNPHCRYVDLDRHGFFILDVKPDSIHADYYYVSRIDTNVATLQTGNAYKTLKDTNEVHTAAAPAPPKATQDIPTPLNPQPGTSIKNVKSSAVVFSVYPNPANEELYIQLGLQENTEMEITISDIEGRKVASLVPLKTFTKGLYNLRLSLDAVNVSGNYFLQFRGKDFIEVRKLQVTK